MQYSTEIRYEKTFPGKFNKLANLSEFIGKAAERAGFDEIEIYELQLAVDEAFSNIVEHAYGGEDVGDVDCICFDNEKAFTITLHDWGESFDPTSLPEPDFSVPLDKMNSRGAGLVLIRKIMDETNFRFTENDGNFLTMVKNKKV